MITELFDSIKNNDSARVQEIISKHPDLINAYSNIGPGLGAEQNTPLTLAAELGQVDTVQLLLERGADIHKKTTGCCEYNALFAAIYTETPSLEVVKLLLDAGADVNSSNECLDVSALSQAAHYGHEAIAELLIHHGAEINKQFEEGYSKTALMAASEAGHPGIVKLLLKHNADPSLTDTYDETALMKALKNGHESIALLIEEALNKNATLN
jgi:ankyrin repeat protein